MPRKSGGRTAGKSAVETSTQTLLAETQTLVARLVRENRDLKVRNTKLAAELERISRGWDEIRKLAGRAPRPRRR